MHILIADDEPMVRLGIRRMIEDEALGKHRMAEVANGRDVILHAGEQPDLAFVDIRMPLMDGMQAIAEAKQISPRTQWVLVTGFSDFEYAQQGIRLGVTDYLLKPVGPEQLMDVIRAAEHRLMQQSRESNRRLQAELLAHFYQMERQIDPFEESPAFEEAPDDAWDIYLFCVDCVQSGMRARRMRELTEQIAQAIEGEGGEAIAYATFILPSYDLCLVSRARGAQNQHVRAAVGQVWHARQTPLTVLTESLSSLQALYAAYGRMSSRAVLRTVHGFDTCPAEVPDARNEQPALLERALCVEQVGLSFLSQDGLAFRKAIGTFRSMLAESSPPQMELNSIVRYLRAATGLPLVCDAYAELVASLQNCAPNMSRKTAGGNGIVERMKAYVAENYTQDIALGTLADEMNITPNYLSRIFHQHAGCTFVSYLSRVRIGIARQLLAEDPSVSIREISEAVGYENPRHFTKVFTKLTGQNPSTYQSGKAADDGTHAFGGSESPTDSG